MRKFDVIHKLRAQNTAVDHVSVFVYKLNGTRTQETYKFLSRDTRAESRDTDLYRSISKLSEDGTTHMLVDLMRGTPLIFPSESLPMAGSTSI